MVELAEKVETIIVPHYTARYVRGIQWVVAWKDEKGKPKDIVFHRGVRVVIDDELYDQLFAHAVDYVRGEDNISVAKEKFQYARLEPDINGKFPPVGYSLDPMPADIVDASHRARIRDRSTAKDLPVSVPDKPRTRRGPPPQPTEQSRKRMRV